MHPELKAAAAKWIIAHRTYEQFRADHWPYAEPRQESDALWTARLDAMCELNYAEIKHLPYLYQRERFFLRICRVRDRYTFTPNIKPAYEYVTL